MENDPRSRATALLVGDGDAASAEELLPLVYDELRGLARGYLAAERRDHTLQATALVHEAYVRLVDATQVSWQGRTHFFAVSAKAMRRVLIDHARRKASAKRGGDWRRVTLGGSAQARELDDEELLALDEALEALAKLDEREARVVELRFFAGMRMVEVAEALGVSKRTAEGLWTHARAWLNQTLARREAVRDRGGPPELS